MEEPPHLVAAQTALPVGSGLLPVPPAMPPLPSDLGTLVAVDLPVVDVLLLVGGGGGGGGGCSGGLSGGGVGGCGV